LVQLITKVLQLAYEGSLKYQSQFMIHPKNIQVVQLVIRW